MTPDCKVARPWAVFPPITQFNCTRLPRAASDSNDRTAGQCLIALSTKAGRKSRPDRVLVRNCYYRPTDPIIVENMREFLPKRAVYRVKRGVSLNRLLGLGFTVIEPPFMVREAIPNCIVEVSAEEFAALRETNVDRTPGGMEAQAFRPDETPMLRLIRLHWKHRRLQDNWTPERVLKICELMGSLTPAELAAMIQWAPGSMDAFMKGGGTYLPGPVAVWFYFFENFHTGRSTFPGLPADFAKAS